MERFGRGQINVDSDNNITTGLFILNNKRDCKVAQGRIKWHAFVLIGIRDPL